MCIRDRANTRLNLDSCCGANILSNLLLDDQLVSHLEVLSGLPHIDIVLVNTLWPGDDLIPADRHMGGVSLGDQSHHGLLEIKLITHQRPTTCSLTSVFLKWASLPKQEASNLPIKAVKDNNVTLAKIFNDIILSHHTN